MLAARFAPRQPHYAGPYQSVCHTVVDMGWSPFEKRYKTRLDSSGSPHRCSWEVLRYSPGLTVTVSWMKPKPRLPQRSWTGASRMRSQAPCRRWSWVTGPFPRCAVVDGGEQDAIAGSMSALVLGHRSLPWELRPSSFCFLSSSTGPSTP